MFLLSNTPNVPLWIFSLDDFCLFYFTLDFSVGAFGCGPLLLPSHLSSVHLAHSSPSVARERELRLVALRGYSSQDMEAVAQLRGVLDAAGAVGVDERDLYRTHAHLEEQQCGRTRNLQQYLKVSTGVNSRLGIEKVQLMSHFRRKKISWDM